MKQKVPKGKFSLSAVLKLTPKKVKELEEVMRTIELKNHKRKDRIKGIVKAVKTPEEAFFLAFNMGVNYGEFHPSTAGLLAGLLGCCKD